MFVIPIDQAEVNLMALLMHLFSKLTSGFNFLSHITNLDGNLERMNSLAPYGTCQCSYIFYTLCCMYATSVNTKVAI